MIYKSLAVQVDGLPSNGRNTRALRFNNNNHCCKTEVKDPSKLHRLEQFTAEDISHTSIQQQKKRKRKSTNRTVVPETSTPMWRHRWKPMVCPWEATTVPLATEKSNSRLQPRKHCELNLRNPTCSCTTRSYVRNCGDDSTSHSFWHNALESLNLLVCTSLTYLNTTLHNCSDCEKPTQPQVGWLGFESVHQYFLCSSMTTQKL